MNNAIFSSDNMNWCTPQEFFEQLNEEFHFTLDAAASHKSAKCKKYFTPQDDGLKQPWNNNIVFCNPPYGKDICKWVRKAYEESKRGTTVVLLIPSRTDTKYFHDYIYGKAELRFVRGRLKFTDENGMTKGSSPFPSLLVVYNGVKKNK